MSSDELIVTQSRAGLASRLISAAAACLRWLLMLFRQPSLCRQPFFRIDGRLPVELGRGADISLGRGVHFRGGGHLYCQGRLSIGDDVFFNHGVVLSVYGDVKVGSHVRVGERVSIHDENHRYGDDRGAIDEWSSYRVRPVHIADGVWIGANAVILAGASIAEDSVVAAGSVVSGQFPRRSLIAGTPARLIRSLDGE